MRKLPATLLLVLVLMVALTMTSSAQAPGPGQWNVGFTMQNLSGSTATVHIDFIQDDGSAGGTWDGTIAGNGSQFLYSGALAGLANETAATISSDMDLAVVANLASSGPKTEAAYSGVSDAQTAATLFAPGVYKNYYNNYSSIRVQNAGTSKTCVRVSYYALGNTTPIDTDVADVAVGAGHTFSQDNNAALGASFIGSAAIESMGTGITGCGSDTTAAQKLAAIVNIKVTPGPSAGNPTALYLFGSYNAVSGGGSVAYVPVLANNYFSYNSSLTVLNRRNNSQWVRVSYDNGNVREKQLNANSSALWYTPNEGLPAGWFGSAKAECIGAQGGSVTTDCEIVATVNQIGANGAFAAYNGFIDGSGTVRLPIVNKRYAPTYGGYTTSVTCQNVGSVTTNVSLTLTGSNTAPTINNVAPNGKAFWYLYSVPTIALGFNGSATAAASAAGAKIVCIGQQNGETPTTAGDWLTTYSGTNQ
jgi:hypothetical protein